MTSCATVTRCKTVWRSAGKNQTVPADGRSRRRLELLFEGGRGNVVVIRVDAADL